MHLIKLSEPCPFPFENPTETLPKNQTLLCTTDIVKLLCFADSHMEIRPYNGPVLHSIKEIEDDLIFSLIIQGSAIDHLLAWQQLESLAFFDRCKLYTHHSNAKFFNALLNTHFFLSLPQKWEALISPYLYAPHPTYNAESLKICRDLLNCDLKPKPKALPQKNQLRVALALQSYKEPQALNKPLIRELISYLKEHERLILWDQQDVDFIYPDHFAYQFDSSIKFSIRETLELLKNVNLYIGPYNHWMCLALIFELPVLALTGDRNAIEWLKNYPQGTHLPKITPASTSASCCLCGDLNSKIACKPFCKQMEILSIDQISDYLFLYLETNFWPL